MSVATFVSDKPIFPFYPSTISGQLPIFPNYSVAGDDDGDSVMTVCGSHRPDCFGIFDPLGLILITYCCSVFDFF